MNLAKANLFTVVQFGTKELFIEKLKMDGYSLSDVTNLRDDKNISLLEKSLICRKFDLSQMLLEENVELNVVSDDNCNELHYLSANLGDGQSFLLAKQLIELGVNLNLPDKKYGNTPFWYLCHKAIQKNNDEMNSLIVLCMKKAPNLDLKNVAGNTVKSMIRERGSEELKRIVLKEDNS